MIFFIPFFNSDWHKRLGGSLHADAIMDRIVHNSIMRERAHKNNEPSAFKTGGSLTANCWRYSGEIFTLHFLLTLNGSESPIIFRSHLTVVNLQ